jgi:hypothetical protein
MFLYLPFFLFLLWNTSDTGILPIELVSSSRETALHRVLYVDCTLLSMHHIQKCLNDNC